MSEWFDKNRLDMQTRAQKMLLKYGITGTSTVDDMLQLDATLETFNKNHLHSDQTLEDIGSEILQAIVAETVQICDSAAIYKLKNEAFETKDVEYDLFDGDEYVTHTLLVAASLVENKKTTPFIIASPITIALLQCQTAVIFEPSVGGTFRGPCNSLKVGTLDGVPVFSSFMSSTDDHVDEVVVGGYNEEDETFSSIIINLHTNYES